MDLVDCSGNRLSTSGLNLKELEEMENKTCHCTKSIWISLLHVIPLVRNIDLLGNGCLDTICTGGPDNHLEVVKVRISPRIQHFPDLMI